MGWLQGMKQTEIKDDNDDNSYISLDEAFEQTIYLMKGKRYPIGDEVRQDL